MSNIEKISKATLSKNEEKLLAIKESLHIGKLFLDSHYICKIREIKKNNDDKENTIYYDYSIDLGKTWSNYGSEPEGRFIEKYENNFIDNLEEFLKEVNQVVSGEKSINDYKDSETLSEETGLMHVKSTEYLIALQDKLDIKRAKAELIAKGVNLQMERVCREMDTMRRSLEVIVQEFRAKVEQIEKVIWTIELYLGIKENIVQIQTGTFASENDAINFWQNTLFMDEEVGDPENDTIDFNNIKDFDSWLLTYSNFYKKYNYELLIPQQKGLICLRVRQEDKKYTSNPFVNAMINQDNHKTYILIRNGENIYRIWADINIYPKLFPDRNELQELKDKWDFLIDSEEKKNSKWIGDSKYGYISDTNEEKKIIDDKLFKYKQYMIMLQGLIDRTEIFYPIPTRVNVMNEESHNLNQVKFVYEDDLRLSDGKLSFNQWQINLNKDIKEGSRILFIKEKSSNSRLEPKERFDQRFNSYNEYRDLPNSPNTGIYNVKTYSTTISTYKKEIANSLEELPEYARERYSENQLLRLKFPLEYNLKNEKGWNVFENVEKKYLAIYYNPKDEVKNGWGYYNMTERKNNLSYKIFNDDADILNYDIIDLKDIEYYLYDRKHRKNYLTMIPILNEIKKQRENELKQETEFVKGLIDDMKRSGKKLSDPKKEIWDAIEWFKLKNKWKRPLTENDHLAWKMIRKKLKLV